jgi:Na+-transporting methylmalonyl-CoA/oxaloacetate decarboxylase gamma subunit
MMLATSWPDAALGMAGIALVTVVLGILIWQIFATGRTGLSAKRENAYRKLAEDATDAQRRTADQLEKAAAELAHLRRQTDELERVLKAVE